MMPVIVWHEHNEVVNMQWGLVSRYSKNKNETAHLINARAETLDEKPIFRTLLLKNRCLVPASGFYEWKKEGNRRTPFYIHLKENPVFAFAGLCDICLDTTGTAHPAYVIITNRANSLVAPMHDRMPVILKPGDEDRWLSGEPLDKEEMKRILDSFPSDKMIGYPVSSRVNNTAEDDEELIHPIETL
jgi:putative SOS response-associated peptidase YedK